MSTNKNKKKSNKQTNKLTNIWKKNMRFVIMIIYRRKGREGREEESREGRGRLTSGVALLFGNYT